jgi:prepilin-type N-terminal cleavage/methylation domain-containing protein
MTRNKLASFCVDNRGFSLGEMLVVTAIIASSPLAMPSFLRYAARHAIERREP